MSIYTIGNTKGGVGKTTVALNLAISRALDGRDVLFIDADAQGTGQLALTIRAESEIAPLITCAQYADGQTLRHQVKQLAGKFDDVVIDVGGRDTAALRVALTLTDTLVVPFAPRSFDVWALSDISRLIDEARGIRGDFPAFAFLNNADANGSDNDEAKEAMADFPGLVFLDAQIRRRKAIATAAGRGLSVLEHTPRDTKACEEVQNMIHMICI